MSDVPEIEVVEVGAEVGEAIEAAHVARTLLDLDVKIDADNRIFVTGRGLESEWSSDVHVRGTSVDPRAEGARYRARFAEHANAVRQACVGVGADFEQITTDRPLELVLLDLFRARSRRGKGGR